MRTIRAFFFDGRSAVYTEAVEGLLKSDPAVGAIHDAETGDLIFYRGYYDRGPLERKN